MNYINILQDSIETSINMNIFKNKNDAMFAHIFKSKIIKIPLTKFKNVNNFDSNRLQKNVILAYPINNRPRGNDDISSVKYYQKKIKQKKDILPIWMICKDNKYILLDGVHRIIASYIENKKKYKCKYN